jgi:hypothetical protein
LEVSALFQGLSRHVLSTEESGSDEGWVKEVEERIQRFKNNVKKFQHRDKGIRDTEVVHKD